MTAKMEEVRHSHVPGSKKMGGRLRCVRQEIYVKPWKCECGTTGFYYRCGFCCRSRGALKKVEE